MAAIDDVKMNVEKGKLKQIKTVVQDALDQGCKPDEILNSMISAMDVVGKNFEEGKIYVPQMLVAAKTMAAGVDVLKPLMKGENVSRGTYIIGTVSGDLHDIGKNLVAMMIESAGFNVIDLGVDVPIEKFEQAVREHPDVKIVGCSALLTTTLQSLENTVKALNKLPNRSSFKIMVGGAPVTPEFAKKIGADAYTANAAEAAAKAKELAA